MTKEIFDLKYGDVIMFLSSDKTNPTLVIKIFSIDENKIIDFNSKEYLTMEIKDKYNKAYILNRCNDESKE